jgi:hypothetical protein
VEVDQVATGVIEYRIYTAAGHPRGLLDEYDALSLDPIGFAFAVVSV